MSWQWIKESDNGDLFTKDGEGANAGKIAWFLRPRAEVSIWRAESRYSPPNELGRRRTSISFEIGSTSFSRVIAAGGSFFVCVMDEKDHMESPTGYIRHTQRWQYNGTKARRVSPWFDPDDEEDEPGSPGD